MPTFCLETNVKVSKSSTTRQHGVFSLEVLQVDDPKEFVLSFSKVEQVLYLQSTSINHPIQLITTAARFQDVEEARETHLDFLHLQRISLVQWIL